MATVKYLDENGLSTVWSKVKGIVTPKADKVSSATNGHLAGLNSSGNLTDSGLAATNIAQKDGSYSGMTVGAAEDLVSAESVASEFTSRITGGSTAVGKGGTALVDRIKGRTLVWNQLVQNGDFSDSSSGWSATGAASLSVSSKVASITTTGQYGVITHPVTIVDGHKFYFAFSAKASSTTLAFRGGVGDSGYFGSEGLMIPITVSSTDETKRFSTVGTFKKNASASAKNFVLFMDVSPSVHGTVSVSNAVLIDLTLLFGAGSEPATPKEFEALYPDPFYDYNAGELINNAATAIETVGWNIWDEEWEVGFYSLTTGAKQSESDSIRSINPIPVFPGTRYSATRPSGKTLYMFFYDASRNFIIENHDGAVNAPSNAAYMHIALPNLSPAIYGNNICINISDTNRNGTYEPYWRSELELGLGDIKVKSHNLWDEEWEAGGIDATTGQNDSTSNIIRAKNYTPVTGGQSYYIYMGSAMASQAISMRYYDANKNLIGTTDKNGSSNGANLVRVIPDSCAYIRFVTSSYYGSSTTYLNDICINLSDPAFNGRYEPYGDGGVISITGGLKSAGTVYDEVSGNKLVKRLESVGLSMLASWSAYDTANSRYNATVSNMRIAAARVAAALIPINNDYFTYQGRIYIETTNSDRTSFIASLAGVPLYYELAQPIEYELADALPTAMRNDPYGTERRLPEDTAAIVTAPFRADITYSTNIKEAVQSMHQNFINVNSMQDFLAALGEQMGGTWTMRPADGKFDFTFTPNPSNE